MTLPEIEAIFARHGYTRARLARDYGKSAVLVSMVFNGHAPSAPLMKFAERKAREFLQNEQQLAQAG